MIKKSRIKFFKIIKNLMREIHYLFQNEFKNQAKNANAITINKPEYNKVIKQ